MQSEHIIFSTDFGEKKETQKSKLKEENERKKQSLEAFTFSDPIYPDEYL